MSRETRTGTYGVLPVALGESTAWLGLSPYAKLIYATLEMHRLSGLSGIFPYHAAQVAEAAGLSLDNTEEALQELTAKPSPDRSFIVRDARLVWLRNHLNWRPRVTEGNSNYRVAVRNHLLTLPAESIVVRKFRKYYRSFLVDQSEINSQSIERLPNQASASATAKEKASELQEPPSTRARATPRTPGVARRRGPVAIATILSDSNGRGTADPDERRAVVAWFARKHPDKSKAEVQRLADAELAKRRHGA